MTEAKLFSPLKVGAIEVKNRISMAPLTRTISVTARKGILQDMPKTLAETLKPILRQAVVDPAIARHPFLVDALTML